MARGEIKKESKGRKSEKNIKEKPAQQPAYVAAEVISRRKDKDGNRIGKITEAESVVKYEKDTFSLYARSTSGKSVSINDVRGEAVFLRRLPNGKIEMADVFVFCLGGGEYIISDWLTVWKAMDQLNHDHGTVVYMDAWRMNKDKFIQELSKQINISTTWS